MFDRTYAQPVNRLLRENYLEREFVVLDAFRYVEFRLIKLVESPGAPEQ